MEGHTDLNYLSVCHFWPTENRITQKIPDKFNLNLEQLQQLPSDSLYYIFKIMAFKQN